MARDWKREFLILASDSSRLWASAVLLPVCGVAFVYSGWAGGKQPVLRTLIGTGFLALGGLAIALIRWRAEYDREEAAKPVTHEVEVTRDLPHFWAQCSCGWLGDDRKSLEAALQDAQDHAGIRPTKVTIIDDDEDESDEIYQVDVSEAEPPDIHEVNVYWDHRVYAPTCSCGWQGTETPLMSDALTEAKAHGKGQEVEVTDIGRAE